MAPELAREMAMRLIGTEDVKGCTVASLFSLRNAIRFGGPLVIFLAMLAPYVHVDLHECPLEDDCWHCDFHIGNDSGESEIEILKQDWMC